MISGNQVANFYFFIALVFLFLCGPSFSEGIQISPLLNLDEVSPSYDDIIENEVNEDEDGKELNQNFFKPTKNSIIIISILNKITANVHQLKIQIKESLIYDDLRIYPIYCKVSDPSERPEVSAYLNVYDQKTNEKIFAGWMLKTLPSVSSMEHSLYDIWINDCI